MVPRPLAFGGGGGLGAALLASLAHWLWEEPALLPACACPWFTGDLSAFDLAAALFDRLAVPGLFATLLFAVFLAGCCCGGGAGFGVGYWLGRRPAGSVALRGPPSRGYRCPE